MSYVLILKEKNKGADKLTNIPTWQNKILFYREISLLLRWLVTVAFIRKELGDFLFL